MLVRERARPYVRIATRMRHDRTVPGRPDRHPGAPETAAVGLEIVMANVTELRVALTVEDFEQALAFYRDVLGLEQIADWSSGTGRVVALDAGRATLELFDNAQAESVDAIEAGRRVSGSVRFAVRVADSEDMAARAAVKVRGPAPGPVQPAGPPLRREQEPWREEEGDHHDSAHPVQNRLPGPQDRHPLPGPRGRLLYPPRIPRTAPGLAGTPAPKLHPGCTITIGPPEAGLLPSPEPPARIP
jgi:catechol 2,3-dioxygenase-like lactoylglutathione lyase family enzyme